MQEPSAADVIVTHMQHVVRSRGVTGQLRSALGLHQQEAASVPDGRESTERDQA